MTQPTQAQIEAAAKATWERYKGFPWPGNQELWEDAIKAGFVAAAQVGGPLKDAAMGVADEALKTAMLLIETRAELKTIEAATIERCVQVAEYYQRQRGLNTDIAAALRKLKDVP